MKTEIVPFHMGLLPAAAELLAARHARDRARLPLLPGRFEESRTAASAVREVWGKPNSSGVAAWQDGRMVGYLIGQMLFDDKRGRHIWMHLPGHALAADVPADLCADLYAAAATRWLEMGAFDHYIMMPARDRAELDVWFALSFGQEAIHGMRSLTGPLPAPVDVPGIVIRRATADDRNAFIGEMPSLLARHHTEAPVWAAFLPEWLPTVRDDYDDLLTNDDVFVWLAELEGESSGDDANGNGRRIVGHQIYRPMSPSDDSLTIPMSGRAILLDIAAVQPEWRRHNIGHALTAVGMAAAAAGGYTVCVVDWRTTNLDAQRVWPRMGFQPAAYRLVRKVDPRISWARL